MKSKCVVEYKNDSGYVGVTLERKNNMSLVLWTVLEEPEWVPDYCLTILYSL